MPFIFNSPKPKQRPSSSHKHAASTAVPAFSSAFSRRDSRESSSYYYTDHRPASASRRFSTASNIAYTPNINSNIPNSAFPCDCYDCAHRAAATMNTTYSPYATTPGAEYYRDKDYVSPSPTPSPRGPTYYYGSQPQPQRPATRAHFRHMSSGGGIGPGGSPGVFHEYAGNAFSPRPPTFSPRYNTDGHYATANVSSSRSARKHSSASAAWASPSSAPPPRRERRSASFSYYRASDSIGDSDEDEIRVDGVTYVLPAKRPRPRKHSFRVRAPPPRQPPADYYVRSGDGHRGDRQYYSYDDAYRTNHSHHYTQGGYGFVEKDLGPGFESPRYHGPSEPRRTTPTSPTHVRRASTSMPMPARSATARPSSSQYRPPPPTSAMPSSARRPSVAQPSATAAAGAATGGSGGGAAAAAAAAAAATSTSTPAPPAAPRATEADAKEYGIPAGYSLKNWDPTEEPIMLLGSVFDANSLGKWIYDWTTYHHGPSSPIAEVAGELWLLLIQLAGKIKRTDEVMQRVRTKENREMLNDFIDSGERLTDKLRKLLKTCEAPMLRTTGKREKAAQHQLGKNAGIEFVETLFGREREMDKTERFMQSVRLWNLRFDANCEDILRKPTQ